MGDKYIIEIEDKPFHKEDGDFLYRVKGFNSLVFDMTGISKLTPYTEPDLEQVRKEAYEEGKKQAKVQAELDVCHDIEKVAKENYKAGLSDAWEAARRIVRMPEGDLLNVFTECYSAVCTALQVILKYDAPEAIEKLRDYEQDEKIKVGDEVEDGVANLIVTEINNDGTVTGLTSDGSFVSAHVRQKTGRHFPEIATILENMRGEQDG